MRLDITSFSTLAEAQAAAKRAIDEAAGKARDRYITTTPGQSETYLSKAADADAYKAAGYPADTTPYPWVAAEVTATGLTAQQAADAIIAQRDAWVAIGAQIEAERLKGKRAVDAATTIQEAAAARHAAVQALDAI